MDSKYSIFTKNRLNSTESSPFSQNMKRKFAYGSSNSAHPAKKPNLQIVPKLSNPSPHSTQNNSSFFSNKKTDIQIQRQRLPVFAVRDQ